MNRAAEGGGTDRPILKVDRLKAYYQMSYFGIEREVRAVDDITLQVNRNEIYGLAGESSSGKTSFIKTIASTSSAARSASVSWIVTSTRLPKRSWPRSAGSISPTSCRDR